MKSRHSFRRHAKNRRSFLQSFDCSTRRPRRLGFEGLEDRHLLATLWVDPTPGSGGTEFTAAGGSQPGSMPGLVPGVSIFSTISAAVTAATAGDTINVADGTYSELVTVNKSLDLRGNQFDVDARSRAGTESIVNGNDLGGGIRSTSFSVTADDVVLNGFTVQQATSGNQFGFGIVLGAGTAGSEVRNNILQDNIAGLSLANDNAANPTVIERNLFRNNNQPGPVSGSGIYTDQFNAGGALTGVQIQDNTFLNNVGSDGLSGTAINLSSTQIGSQSNITIQRNLFDGNGRALLAFNLVDSSFTSNTVTNSQFVGSADLRLFEGVNNLTITHNVLQGNGTDVRGLRISNIGTGAPDATNVTFRLNSVTGYGDATLDSPTSDNDAAIEIDVGSYSGSFDATCNWWGDITGPTTAANPGGAGEEIIDPDGVVDFQPWLVYSPDGNASIPGIQFVGSFTVPAQVGGFTATNNNYRRLVNAIDCLQPGQTVTLSGIFDWTEANAAASWALGNDGVASTADDFSLAVRPNLNNVTLTAAALGSATIQGPGDVASANLEGVFTFDGGDNQNWTISNLQIFDFDLAIGMFNGAGGSDAYNNTQILNNNIRIPADLNATAAPADVNQNIGIHFSFGTNQTIQGNTIDIAGDGVSNSGSGTFASSVGMQSNTSGGSVYDGLLIDNNAINILNAQSADPERILGIWENAHGHSSDITVSNNDFVNLAAGNNAALNLQRAFRVTSHSSASSTVTYTGNTASGANIGFEWLASSNFAGNQAVRLWQNTLTNNATGVLVQSNGIANVYQNTITGSGAGGGVHVITGGLTGSVPVTNAVQENFISGGSGDGILIDATAGAIGSIFNNDLSGNAGLGVNNLSAGLVNASANWLGSNTPAGAAGEVSANVDYTPWLDVGTDISATTGFQGSFDVLHVDDDSTQAGAIGRIQEAVDLATGATPTVVIHAGTYLESVAANKANLTLDGATGIASDVVIDPSAGNGITISADNVTLLDLRVTGAVDGISASGVIGPTLTNVQSDNNSDSGISLSNVSGTTALASVVTTGNAGSGLVVNGGQTLNLSDLTITGNGNGGSISNVTTLNFTGTTGNVDDVITASGSSLQHTRDPLGANVVNQTLQLANVANLNLFGDSGNDTFNVTPDATMNILVSGGPPVFPTLPGDTLNYLGAGTILPSGIGDGTIVGVGVQPLTFTSIENLTGGPFDIPAPGSITVFNNKIDGSIVTIVTDDGQVSIDSASLGTLTPGNGIVNLVGDNDDTIDQMDNFVVVGTGPNSFDLLINGSSPVSFTGVLFFNVTGHDLVDTLELTAYADNTPQAWGIDVFYDEGLPNQTDGDQVDLLIYHTSIGLGGGGSVSENIDVVPSGADSGEVRVTNAADGSVIVVIQYVANTDIVVIDDDGSLSDTDTLTLHGTSPEDSPNTSGNETVVANFTAAGDALNPWVTVSDGASILYRLRSFTGLGGVNFALHDGNDSMTLNSGAVQVDVDAGRGNDTINAAASTAPVILRGGEGDDTLIGGSAADRIEGGSGNDNLQGGADADQIFGGDGNDLIFPGLGGGGIGTSQIIDGGEGVDQMEFFEAAATVSARNLLGTLYLEYDANSLRAGSVETIGFVNSFAGPKTWSIDDLSGTGLSLFFVEGNSGGGFADTITVHGTSAADDISVAQEQLGFASVSFPTVNLPWGKVSIVATAAEGDTLVVHGDEGDDTIIASPEVTSDPLNSVLVTLHGDAGNDALTAGGTLSGGAGDDTLVGGAGDDSMDGGTGDDTFVGNGGTDAIGGGAGSSVGDTILIGGTAGDDVISLSLNASGHLIVTVNGATTTYTNFLGGPIATCGVEQLLVDGLAGDDSLTVDSINGAIPIAINFHGGGNADLLTLTGGTATSDVYTPGPNPGQGTSTIVIGSVTQTVTFTGLEPVLDLVAGPLTVNGTNADNAINYSQGSVAANGLVSVDGFETIEFSGKTSLTINALAGSDTINLNSPTTPAGLTGITVNGGDPTAGDTVIVNGTAGVDAVTIDQLTQDGARVVVGAGATINVTTVAHLTYNGQGGSDNIGVITPLGGDAIDFIPGADMTEASLTLVAFSGEPRISLNYLQVDGLGTLSVSDAGAGRSDILNVFGTDTDDLFTLSAAGGILVEDGSLNNITLSISTPGIGNLKLLGLEGDDTFNVPGNHPFAVSFGGAALQVEGGDSTASDVLNFTGTGGAITVNYGAGTIAEAGFAPVSLSGVELLNVDAAGGSLTALGSAGDETLDIAIDGTSNGTATSSVIGAPVTAFANVGTLSVDLLAGDNTLRLHYGSDPETIVVDGAAGTVAATNNATVTILETVNFANVDSLRVFGNEGNDAFTVTPSDTMPIFIDGGDPIGTIPGDSLTVNGAIGQVQPGPENDEGGFITTGETVSFDHIESLVVVTDAECPFLIVGTNGDDDITIIARDATYSPLADGVQDFTYSINGGPEILVLNEPDVYIDAAAGDDDIVIRAPANDITAWGIHVRVAGGPPSIGETNEADRLVLETPGQDNLVFTPTGPDTGTLLIDEIINGTFDAGTDTLIEIGSFVFVCPDIDLTYTSSPGGVELVEYDGESPADEITIAGSAANDTTTLNPAGIGAGSFASGLSPVFNFRSFSAVTVNAGGGGFDQVIVNTTEGADTVLSTANTLLGPGAAVTIGAEIDQLNLNTLGGSDNIDLDLNVANLAIVVDAGAGNDTLNLSGSTAATIFGGLGNDLLTGSPQRDSIDGGAGDDVLFGLGAADTLHGGDGNDMIVGGAGDDFAYGGAGSDTFVWNPGDADDLFEGDDGDDTLAFAGANGNDAYVVSGNNGRVNFQRQPGNVGVNMGGVENIVANSETVQLSGRNEVPANISPASGFANFTYNEAAGTFDIRMFVTGLTSAIIDSHIHVNVPGSNGPVVVPFGPGFVPVAGGFELTAEGLSLASIVPPAGFTAQDVLMEILLGRAYFNIHTTVFPGGEVRGNIIAPSSLTAGSGGGDSLEVRDSTGTALRNITFDAGNEAEIRNGAALVDTVIVQGLDTADGITASVPNILDNSYLVTGLPYRIVVSGSDGNPASGALRDQFTLNGNGGDDSLKAQAPIENVTRVTLDGGVGDDFLSADAILIGGPGDDFLEGGAGDDQFFGNEGEDTMIGNGGNDTFDGGPDFDTILVRGTSGNDAISINQTAATTLVHTVNGNAQTDTLVTIAGVRTVEAVRALAGAGDDTISVTWADSLGVDATVNSLRVDVIGGPASTRDRLGVVDGGTGDLLLYRRGTTDDAGSITVGPGNAEPLEMTFVEVEFAEPIAGAGGDVVVFKHDPLEFNNARTIATFLGANDAINVDPTIDPGVDPIFGFPSDQDWYRVVAETTGVLDFQVYFRQIAAVPSGRPGLPNAGNLDIQVTDAVGNVIAGFGVNDATDDERVRIPVVAGRTYYLRVFANATAVNVYNVLVDNYAPPVAYDLELDDLAVNPAFVCPQVNPAPNSDTGRSHLDNVTCDATPTIRFRLDDGIFLHDLPGNPVDGSPPDEVIVIPFQAGAGAPGYRLAVFDEGTPQQPPALPQVPLGFATQVAEGVYEFTTPTLTDGSHFLSVRVQMVDPATPQQTGFGGRSASLEIVVDTIAPPVSLGEPGIPDDGVISDSDTGISPPNPHTIIDRITFDTTPTFWGRAEANAIIRVYADVNGNGTLEVGTDVFLGQDTAIPLDGNNQEPDGYWEIGSVVSLNDPDFFPIPDGLRTIFVTAEDLAGNVNAAGGLAGDTLEIFIDTQGPRVTDVDINNAGNPYDLFDPKPSEDGPTPLVNSIVISFSDLPNRLAPDFLFPALKQDVAESPGHYLLVGDYNGIIPIAEVIVTNITPVSGSPAFATVELVFATPLPDDRFTLTISDSISDPVGNALDGESNADEPQEDPTFPSGDGIPGGDFVARFTIDTRPEVGTWGADSIWIDTNGNTRFDPDNADFTNRDITYTMGLTSDDIFAGNFAAGAGDTADGFDKLAAYGRVNGLWRWMIDTDNDGVPNINRVDPAAINGVPVSGNFDGNAANGDEVGLFTGTKWWFDTNHDFRVDFSITSAAGLIGYPIVGDFDGDGNEDLATWTDDRFRFNLSSTGPTANARLPGLTGAVEASFNAGFSNPNERPVAADMNMDGFDDIGLYVPNRAGASPDDSGAEWYFLMSGMVQNNDNNGPATLGPSIIDRIVSDPLGGGNVVRYTPVPFGNDLYIQYGDAFGLPVLGNFDPPVTPSSGGTPEPTRDPLDVNNDGKISAFDALLIVNHMNQHGPGAAPPSSQSQQAPYLDVNGSGTVTASDALAIVNYLNANASATEQPAAEGEADEFFSSLGTSSTTSQSDDVLALLADDLETQRRKRG